MSEEAGLQDSVPPTIDATRLEVSDGPEELAQPHKSTSASNGDTVSEEAQETSPSALREMVDVAMTPGGEEVKTARRSHFFMTEIYAAPFFCRRPSAFEAGVEACKKYIKDTDGEVLDSWCITTIDHWDLDKERLVILTQTSLFIFQYDFISLKVKEYKHVPLNIVTSLLFGNLTYPEYSLMGTTRNYGGLKVEWRGTAPDFLTRWNPFSKVVPYLVFTNHPTVYYSGDSEKPRYSVDHFGTTLWRHLQSLPADSRTADLAIASQDVVISSYASVTSPVHNQSHLGFYRERNGVSF